MTAELLPLLRLGALAPFALSCSILIETDQYVSPIGALPAGASGIGGSGATATAVPSFVVLAGERDDIHRFGAFATDVTYGGFDQNGTLRLWAAWTLPAAGRYVAARQSDKVWVFGDPDDTNEEMSLWSSEVKEGLLSSWQRAPTASPVRWAAVAVAEPDVITIAADAEDHLGSELSLLSLQSPSTLRPAGVSLLTPRLAASVAFCSGYLFVVGGKTRPDRDPVVIAAVESAAVTAQSVGPMATCAELQVTGKPLPRTGVALACGGQRLYVVGGDAAAYQGAGSVDVLSGIVESDGTIKKWDVEPSLLYPVSRAAAVVAAGRLVVAGGFNATRLATVSYSELDANGHVAAWQLEGNQQLPVAVQDPSAVALE